MWSRQAAERPIYSEGGQYQARAGQYQAVWGPLYLTCPLWKGLGLLSYEMLPRRQLGYFLYFIFLFVPLENYVFIT
jgi:hypothetical protein